MLRAHHAVGAAVRLAGDHRDLGDRCLREGVKQLGALPDDPAVLLLDARQKPRDVLHDQEGDVERVAEPHEARPFDGGVDVKHASEVRRLVGHHSHGPAGETDEAHDDVAREVGVDLEELSLVGHGAQELLDVVGLVGVLRHQRVERAVLSVGGVLGGAHRRVGRVVGGEKPHKPANAPERVDVVLAGEVGHARDLAVGRGAPEPLHRHVFVRHGADDLGARHEHVARVLRHEHEIGDCG